VIRPFEAFDDFGIVTSALSYFAVPKIGMSPTQVAEWFKLSQPDVSKSFFKRNLRNHRLGEAGPKSG
jgi:hypothetical protein